jgi:transcriptional regulator with XRE-family HTH domain
MTKKPTNKLREIRQARGWSLTELSWRSGVGISTLCRAEKWGFRVSRQTAERLAGALGCEVGDVFSCLKTERNTEP